MSDVRSICVIRAIRGQKNIAFRVVALGVAHPLLPDLHFTAIRTIVPLYTHLF